MLLATAVLVMGAALPAQTPVPTPTPTPAIVNIPDTEINVCAIVTLDDLTAALRIEAEAALGEAGTTLPALQALCDDDDDGGVTTTPPVTTDTATPTTEPDATLAPLPDADDNDGGSDDGDTVTVVPRGAPDTGDGSTEPAQGWLAMLLALGLGGLAAARAGWRSGAQR